jgi:hypothetical protein
MKWRWIVFGLVVIILALVLAINIPIKTEVSTISVNELNEDDPYYGELAKEIRDTISKYSDNPVCFGQVYTLRAHYLLGNDKVVISVPYIATFIVDTGMAGNSGGSLWFNSLTTVWNGGKHKSLKIPSAKSSKCYVEADPNTYLNVWDYKRNYFETELNDKNNRDTEGMYYLYYDAVTKDTGIQPNAECTVSIRWDGKMVLPLGVFWHKSIPFEVTASAKYLNNVH